ncbi:MAG: M20/M25/M40 family metallo-hydrolase [Anaerolineales bacterium]|nr:M20/M25/M40 family metallo-hydrolase [Anaerolineales bacterium]
MFDFTSVDHYLDSNLQTSLEELKKLCAQPSVAAQNLGMPETAEMVLEMLKIRGFEGAIHQTKGFPVVIAERKGRSDKTLLIYNHYDVQPAEPLDLWTSPPFQPEERDGKVFGRGISDDKGHFVSRLFAIDALLNELDDLPCNIKFILEGEEEIGSVNLPEFVIDHQDLLAADACIWEFGGVDHRDIPMQYLGLRGICYVELSVTTANQDVHSGLGGSIFPNAAWRLNWALSTLKDPQEKIHLPGFYDPIIPPSERDIEMINALPPVSDEYRSRYGINNFLQEYPDETALQTASIFEPTCTICGLTSGYQGPGSKTVLPSKASAKVDFRLVPNQTPAGVLKQLRAHLDQEGFSDIKIEFLGGGPPARTDPDHPFVKLVVETSEDAFGHPMQLVPMVGGSGPNHAFVTTLNLPVVTTGLGYPGGNAHAPDENIRIDLYLKGAKHIARIIQAFGDS